MTSPTSADNQTKPDPRPTVFCPCCDDQTQHRLMFTGVGNKGKIYRCTKCELRRLLPLPDATVELEDGHGMYTSQTADQKVNHVYEKQVAQAVKGYLSRLAAMGKTVRTMLDLGGGMGYYSRAFARAGVAVTYLDRDPVSIRFAEPLNKPLGIEVRTEPIETFADNPDHHGRFDLIFFRHVIEHCHHPDEVLAAARKLCAADGTIIVETDNNRSIEHLLHPGAGPYWHGVYRDHYQQGSLLKLCGSRPLAIDKDETHYYAFRIENLRTLTERTGWRVLEAFDYPLGHRTFWPNIDRPTSRSFWRVRCRSDLLRAAAFTAAYPFMRAAGMGAGLAVFATPVVQKAQPRVDSTPQYTTGKAA